MQFSEILGQKYIKKYLTQSVLEGRIPHAQLFVGAEGSGVLPMAIAYSQYILCENVGDENFGGKNSCNLKFKSISHPDLHFIFPTVTTQEVKAKPRSIDFIKDWHKFILKNPYGSLFDWYTVLDVANKQGEIRVNDAQEILKSLSLKSYEGGYKIVIVWMADKMNIEASNKLLKLIEEPPEKTVFILITENEENIIQTIRSRCQVLHFNKISERELINSLVLNQKIDEQLAIKIAHQAQGNYNKALHLMNEDSEDLPFEEWFVVLVRSAFKAKINVAGIQDLIVWSDQIASIGRETQKKFLRFCIEMFRQSLILNYQVTKLVYIKPQFDNFKLENFAPFINGNNINNIFNELSSAIYHIERNANAKIILTNLTINLTRLIR